MLIDEYYGSLQPLIHMNKTDWVQCSESRLQIRRFHNIYRGLRQKLTHVRGPDAIHLAEIRDVSSINYGICGELMSMWVATPTLNKLSSTVTWLTLKWAVGDKSYLVAGFVKWLEVIATGLGTCVPCNTGSNG